MAAQHNQRASPLSMLYLAPILLVLVIQATFVVTPALAHSTAVTSDSYALVPRGEASFHLPPVYIEVHPCSAFFKPALSLLYKIHHNKVSLAECSKIKSVAAWRTTDQQTGVFACTPMWYPRHSDPLSVQVGECFIFHQPAGGPTGDAWAHPCESREHHQKFSVSFSIWYSAWYFMPFDLCKKKKHAGAWQADSECHVFPGPQLPYNKQTPGVCFVLDKVPVDSSYVEVHPCDSYFHAQKTEFFIHQQFSLGECRTQEDAAAWMTGGEGTFKCVPLPSQIVEGENNGGENEQGHCFKMNKANMPHGTRNPDSVSPGYMHACQTGFSVASSHWYSRLDEAMDIKKCDAQKGAGAWRKRNTEPCTTLYLGKTVSVRDNNWAGQYEGDCFVRNKVVPLNSDVPPWLAPPIKHNPHGAHLVGRDVAGLVTGQKFETYTPDRLFGDAGCYDEYCGWS